jgi:glyoxylase-like metal-dependent hydrolase (beta-lactamase superfamily II)
MSTPYKTFRLSDRISLIQEPGVSHVLRCNIWHVRGRDFDLVVDTGMGLSPLKDWVRRESDRPLKAIVTHCHFDHAGCLHEFDCRLGHPAEADILAAPDNPSVVWSGDWPKIEVVDRRRHPDFNPETYRIRPAPLTGYLDEGDVVDLGDRAYHVLHLPGHSPGSIGLYDARDKVLFSGDAIYDGELLDTLWHSDPETYRRTLERLKGLDAEVIHGGHSPSFGKARMIELADAYLAGGNTITDVRAWYEAEIAKGADLFADQDWSGIPHVA